MDKRSTKKNVATRAANALCYTGGLPSVLCPRLTLALLLAITWCLVMNKCGVACRLAATIEDVGFYVTALAYELVQLYVALAIALREVVGALEVDGALERAPRRIPEYYGFRRAAGA